MGIIVRNMSMSNFSHVRLGTSKYNTDFPDISDYTLLGGTYNGLTGEGATGRGVGLKLYLNAPITRNYYFEVKLTSGDASIFGIGYTTSAWIYGNYVYNTIFTRQTSESTYAEIGGIMRRMVVGESACYYRKENLLYCFIDGILYHTESIADRDDYYLKIYDGSSSGSCGYKINKDMEFYELSMSNVV